MTQDLTGVEPLIPGGSRVPNYLPWEGGPNAGLGDGFEGMREASAFASSLIASRQNVSPKRLFEPGPDAAQMQQLFHAAAAAPDHGLLTPWRFVLVPTGRRADLAEVFALALIDRDPGATLEQIEAEREKAHRAPLLMLAIACLGAREPEIPTLERMVSLGCAVQNMLLCAQAMGFGSSLTSGQAMDFTRMRKLFQLSEGDHAVCFVNVGTANKRRPPRERPEPSLFVSSL